MVQHYFSPLNKTFCTQEQAQSQLVPFPTSSQVSWQPLSKEPSGSAKNPAPGFLLHPVTGLGGGWGEAVVFLWCVVHESLITVPTTGIQQMACEETDTAWRRNRYDSSKFFICKLLKVEGSLLAQ